MFAEKRLIIINLFQTNDPFLYHLKTSDSDVSTENLIPAMRYRRPNSVVAVVSFF